jgi:carbohydrate diacid regulator
MYTEILWCTVWRSSGLDIRKFDDALTFKIAMMVVSYMTYMNNSENL